MSECLQGKWLVFRERKVEANIQAVGQELLFSGRKTGELTLPLSMHATAGDLSNIPG